MGLNGSPLLSSSMVQRIDAVPERESWQPMLQAPGPARVQPERHPWPLKEEADRLADVPAQASCREPGSGISI